MICVFEQIRLCCMKAYVRSEWDSTMDIRVYVVCNYQVRCRRLTIARFRFARVSRILCCRMVLSHGIHVLYQVNSQMSAIVSCHMHKNS